MKKDDERKTNRSVFPDGSSIRIHESDEVAGTVRVHESVISSIVRKTACSVPGVIRLAGNMLVNNIAEFVGSKKIKDRAITVEMGDNSVKVEIRIVVEFGAYLPDVARKVQDAVAEEVTRITGMQIPQVNIVIADVEDPVEEQEEDDGDNAEPEE